MKEVIKKQLENSPKRKGGEKTRMMQMIRLMRLIELMGHYEFIFSYAQARKYLKFFPHKVVFEVFFEVSRV